MSSSILNSIAKSLILVQLDISKLLLHDLQRHLLWILLRLSSLACAPCVVCLTVMDVGEIRLVSRKEAKRWKQTYTHSVAFIMQCVWIFTWLVHCSKTWTGILWFYSLSWQDQLSNLPTYHGRKAPGSISKSENGRRNMGSHFKMLGTHSF